MAQLKNPGPRHTGNFSKPKNTKNTIKRLFCYLGKYKLLLFLSCFCVLIFAFSSIFGTWLIKPLLNDYIIPFIDHANPNLASFIKLLFILGVVYLLGAFSSYANNRIMLYISTQTLFKIRKDLFSKMEKLPLVFFDTRTHGDIMSVYTNDIDTLRDMLNQSIPQFFSSIVSIIGVFIMMVILSPVLTVIEVLIMFFMLFCTKKIGSKSGKAFKEQQQALGALNGYIEEIISGQKVVQVFNREDKTKENFEKLNDNLCTAGTKANSLANILMPLMGNIGHINYAITAIVGAIFVIKNFLDIGSIASFLQYTRDFSMPITQMSQQFNGVLSALAGAERIFKLIDESCEIDEGKITSVDKIKGFVNFSHVNFSYKPNKQVLFDICIDAKPGEKIALVGSTGSGKTTITNLLSRFYDPDSGSITLDGIPINNYSKTFLRKTIGLVLQDTHLFTGTIIENIKFGNPNATDEDVKQAAILANADTFISQLPNGYQTIITGDGDSLSQGQRQLLAIARVVIANPQVLVLDEATSSIDTRTEMHIQDALDKLMHGRTVFVIAHRLSTIRNGSKILVLEQGKIIESGTHFELLNLKGRYFELYTGLAELN